MYACTLFLHRLIFCTFICFHHDARSCCAQELTRWFWPSAPVAQGSVSPWAPRGAMMVWSWGQKCVPSSMAGVIWVWKFVHAILCSGFRFFGWFCMMVARNRSANRNGKLWHDHKGWRSLRSAISASKSWITCGGNKFKMLVFHWLDHTIRGTYARTSMDLFQLCSELDSVLAAAWKALFILETSNIFQGSTHEFSIFFRLKTLVLKPKCFFFWVKFQGFVTPAMAS